jgi:ATP-dependent DNA helicase RecQ
MRLQMARARGVPPYVIFHDTTLRDLARRKPRSLDELHSVYGMGARKIELLGSAVLETIREA